MTREPCCAEKPCILIVEDDRAVSNVIGELLEDHGWKVCRADNGAEALAFLRSGSCRPLGILLDLNMPVMDGWQFRERQLADPAWADIPVILLSAHLDIETAASKMGAVDWLNKPVPRRALLQAVDTLQARVGRGA
ncbi:MAG: response regulator [Myxococcales bacterium]